MCRRSGNTSLKAESCCWRCGWIPQQSGAYDATSSLRRKYVAARNNQQFILASWGAVLFKEEDFIQGTCD
ncbi:hypothetical protein CUU54_19640 [Pectobacterium polaris]|nr:hypothetical protein [Pectobacterium polaris]PWD62137.1 hypothetical protein DF209_03425 [Pectobacterium polaris]